MLGSGIEVRCNGKSSTSPDAASRRLSESLAHDVARLSR